MKAWRTWTCVLTLASATGAQGKVLVVDDDGVPGVDYLTPQAAVDAAHDGDLILIRPGDYGPLSIQGKSLTLQVDGPTGSATLTHFSLFSTPGAALWIAGLGPEDSVAIRGLRVLEAGLSSLDGALSVENSSGPILLESCRLSNLTGRTASIENCASVTFTECEIIGGETFFDSVQGVYLPRPALSVQSSSVWLYGGSVIGSTGPDAETDLFGGHKPPAPGGDAARLFLGASLSAFGTSLSGGAGGSGLPTPCEDGAIGGDAIEVDASSLVRLLASPLAPGAGGSGSPGCTDGASGVAVEGPGTLQVLPGAARGYAASSPVREAADLTLSFAGQDGDLVFVALALEPAAGAFLAPPGIALLLKEPLIFLPAGTLPPGGELSLVLGLPSLGPGVEFARYPSQALFLTGSEVFHSGPTTSTIVDAAF